MFTALWQTWAVAIALAVVLYALRRALVRLGWKRSLLLDVGLVCFGGLILIVAHALSETLFGLDTPDLLGFDFGKHILQLLVVLMALLVT
ncbi:MAG: hypothetical protein RIT14_1080 [Pseudomonadota bacterium]|jgi:hypothetical protein